MKKKEILLPSKRYFKANEEDLTLNVKLENSESLMREGERNIILDLPTLYDDERNQSKNYKIYGKMKMIFRNLYSGSTSYHPLLKNFYVAGDGTGSNDGFVPYNEFALLRNDVLREVNDPYTGNTMNIFFPQKRLEGDRYTKHTTITSIEAPYKNWNLYLSYVDSHDTGFTMNYTLSGGTYCSFTAKDGIPFRVDSTTDPNYYILTSPVEHGMKQDEYIILSGGTYTSDFWVSGVTYSKDNIVHYLDNVYTSKINGNINNTPPTTEDVNWKIVTNWSSTETYNINSLVFYSGMTFKSLVNSNLNNTPPLPPTTGTTYWTRSSNTYYTIPITSDTEKYRIYYIDSVGNQTYDSEKYVINILKNEFSSGTTLSSVVLGRRCLDLLNISGTTSQYYVHKHKTLTTVDDYIMDKVGFETPIWEHERKILFENPLGENDRLVERNKPESVLFDFKKTFTLTGITNNLGYTPTEVYITVLLRNGNGYFTYPPKVGYKFNFHGAELPTGEKISWIDEQFDGTTSIENGLTGCTTIFNGKKYTDLNNEYNYTGITFTGGTEVPSGTTLIGAFVEYNSKDFKERIISEAFHRFSHRPFISGTTNLFNHSQYIEEVYSGASLTNMIGYFYQPHYRVKLRELSPYIETSNTKDILNLPENCIYDETEKIWKWRDLYDHGFVDQEGNGTTFPFINNLHYVMKDINFYLRNENSYINKSDGLNNFNNINPLDC